MISNEIEGNKIGLYLFPLGAAVRPHCMDADILTRMGREQEMKRRRLGKRNGIHNARPGKSKEDEGDEEEREQEGQEHNRTDDRGPGNPKRS